MIGNIKIHFKGTGYKLLKYTRLSQNNFQCSALVNMATRVLFRQLKLIDLLTYVVHNINGYTVIKSTYQSPC